MTRITAEARQRAYQAIEHAEQTLAESRRAEAWQAPVAERTTSRTPAPPPRHSEPQADGWAAWHAWAQGISERECSVLAALVGKRVSESEERYQRQLEAMREEIAELRLEVAELRAAKLRLVG